jgi:hypothetical protein
MLRLRDKKLLQARRERECFESRFRWLLLVLDRGSLYLPKCIHLPHLSRHQAGLEVRLRQQRNWH